MKCRIGAIFSLDFTCLFETCNYMSMCLSWPRGGEASCDQHHCQRRVMGQLPPVLVCWQWSLPGLFDHGYRCRNGIWLAKPHRFRWCSESGHLRPPPNHLVQGQSARVAQRNPFRPRFCRHHHRYNVRDWGSTFSSIGFLLYSLASQFPPGTEIWCGFSEATYLFQLSILVLRSFFCLKYFLALTWDKLVTKTEKKKQLFSTAFVSCNSNSNSHTLRETCLS